MKSKPRKAEKLFVYVDETGQDTQGQIFIVVTIVHAGDRQAVAEALIKAERSSGKVRAKWRKNLLKERQDYLEQALAKHHVSGAVYFRIYRDGLQYKQRTAEVAGGAIQRHCKQFGVNEYTATVIIDGFTKTEARQITYLLRRQGITLHKTRGANDENDPMVRLADALAGMIRDADEGQVMWVRARNRLQRSKLLIEL